MKKNKIKITLVSFVVACSLTGLIYAQESTSVEKVEGPGEFYKNGDTLLQQGKYKEAQEEFQKALNLLHPQEKEKNEAMPASDLGQMEEVLKSDQIKISLDYKDASLANILQSFAYSYNLNIVPPKEIKEKVSISLKDVTIEEALEAILTSNGYAYYKKGNVVYIYPAVGPEETSLVTASFALKYLQAAQAQELISKSLSPKGDIKVNEVNNSLVIRDYSPVLDKIRLLLEDIDSAPLQVLIEAKIVDITSKDLQNLGVTYSATYTAPGGLFKGANSSYDIPGVVHTADQVKGTVTSAGPSSSLSGGQFKLETFIIKNWSATATIDALIQDQKANLLASPSIVTLNGKEAKIVIGEKVPYKEKTQTTTGTTETTKFVDVGTTLRVTPQISPDGYITMVVHPEVSSLIATLDAGPHIKTREADAIVRVKDGETVVIGGLIKNEDTRVRNKIPLLGYLPVVGMFFGNRSTDNVQTELAVFITPHIIKEPGMVKKLKSAADAYVDITGVGERSLVNTLFDKAQNLELNRGIESRRKDEATRLAEAVELYRSLAAQFPGNDKTPESLYRAGKIYYWFYRDRAKALQMFKILTENYPQSPYYANSAYIVRSIERSQARRKK